jgi:hypothetical protein
MKNGNKSIKIMLNYVVGPVLFVVISYVLYRQIIHQPDWQAKASRILSCWKNPLLYVTVLMVMLNWGLETLKWKWLIDPLEEISFRRALKGVLAGCSITMLTPNRIGEYGGRVFFLRPENRINAIPLTILGAMCQLCITFYVGSLGVIFLENDAGFRKLFHQSIPYGALLQTISICISILITLLIFGSSKISAMLMKWSILKKAAGFLTSIAHFSAKQLLRVLFISFLRYSVFILQYYFLLAVMGIELELSLILALLSVFYLLMALAPTIGFTELPLRAGAAVFLLGTFHSNVVGIEAATFGIWIINLVLPAIAGTVVLWKVKWTK